MPSYGKHVAHSSAKVEDQAPNAGWTQQHDALVPCVAALLCLDGSAEHGRKVLLLCLCVSRYPVSKTVASPCPQEGAWLVNHVLCATHMCITTEYVA